MSHIAIIVPGLDKLGGAERQALVLAKELRKRRWRVDMVTLSGTGQDVAFELRAAGIGFSSLEMRKGLADPRGWLRLNRWLRKEAPDIVHAHLPHATLMARWARVFAPVRVVLNTFHTVHRGPLSRRLGYRWSDWLSDGSATVCEEVAAACRSDALPSSKRLVVVPNGIDTSLWKPDAAGRARMRTHLGIEGEFVWLAVGRLDAVKDYPTLLLAMAGLPARSVLLIAGGGPLESKLMQRAGELKIEKRVRFLGFRRDVCGLMQAADAFVLSSRWEGLPLTLLEAGACGLPAVATDVCGSREIILEGITGLLVPTADARALTRAMVKVMGLQSEAGRAMGEKARQSITERYELTTVMNQWEEFYAELLGEHPLPRRRGTDCSRHD